MALPSCTFPFRLHAVLEQICDADVDAETSIVSWTPTGKSFKIHHLGAFTKRILPKYFPNQSMYKSFRRQLQYYGFINYGAGHFGHPFFLRQDKAVLSRIQHKAAARRRTGRCSSVVSATAKRDHGHLLLPESPTPEMARESLDRLIINQVTARGASSYLLSNAPKHDLVKLDSSLLTILALHRLRHEEVLAHGQFGLMSLQQASRANIQTMANIQSLSNERRHAAQVFSSAFSSSNSRSVIEVPPRQQLDLALINLALQSGAFSLQQQQF